MVLFLFEGVTLVVLLKAETVTLGLSACSLLVVHLLVCLLVCRHSLAKICLDDIQDGNVGMGRSGPGLGPGPMASRPILGVMSRPISPRCYGLDGPLGIIGRPKYFFIIPNYEYYQYF